MAKPLFAALLVAAASMLWGADSLLEIPGLSAFPSAALNLYEHLLGLLLLVPFILRPSRRELGRLQPRHILPLFWVCIAGEAVAGLLFGLAYRSVGSSAAGFLQMLQPFCVLAIVWILGRERAASSYLPWAISVLLGAIVIWVFDPSFEAQALDRPEFWSGAGMGLLGVALWAASNVASKILLENFSPSSVAFLRWTLSLPGVFFILWMNKVTLDFGPFLHPGLFVLLLGHTIFFCLAPLWLFYHGLRVLPASLATFLELACPLAIVFLPWIYHGKALQQVQWLGGISMVLGVALLLRLELEFLSGKRRHHQAP